MLQHAPNDGGVLDERDELAPPATARTKRAPMTRKRDQPIEPTPRTPEPRDASPERATSQKVTKLLFHEAGEALPVAEFSRLRQKRLKVFEHHLVQDALRGLPRLVGRCRGVHAWPSAEPVPRSAIPETWGCLDDQAHNHAVSESATGTKRGSFLEAPVVNDLMGKASSWKTAFSESGPICMPRSKSTREDYAKPPSAGRTLALPRKDRDIRYLRGKLGPD